MFVFFFKQKTAYEMRISDWSSDVCSSDLDRCVVVILGVRVAVEPDQHRAARTEQPGAEHRVVARRAAIEQFAERGQPALVLAGAEIDLCQPIAQLRP